jgi:hypothetical protein
MLFNNKKSYILSPADLIKGFFIGLIVGAVLMYLLWQGIIPNPLVSINKPKP